MPYFIIALAVVLVAGLSIANDKRIEKHGGTTEYIWEVPHIIKDRDKSVD